MEVNSAQECEVKPHYRAALSDPELSTGTRFDVLLVADAPLDILESGHHVCS